jgi:hypothetical protein
MPPKSTGEVLSGRNNCRSPRKRKRTPNASKSRPSSPTPADTSYSATLEKGLKTFQAVIAKKTRSRMVSKKPKRIVNGANSSELLPQPLSHVNTKPSTATATTWKFHNDTSTFVPTAPISQSTAVPRPNITKPRYHRKVQIPEPSHPSHDTRSRPSLFSDGFEDELGTGGNESSGMPLLMATEQRFVVQYPNYATHLDSFSVENKLSRHVRRRSAAARRWDRDIIPSLIRPYMEYMRRSQRGQSRMDPPPTKCSCNGHGVLKQVTAVYMDRKDTFFPVLDQILISS